MAPTRKLKCLTIEKKLEILKKVESGNKKKTVAEEYDIPQSTLSTIIKNKSSIVDFATNISDPAKYKRNRPRKAVNAAIYKWFGSARDQNVPVSGPILQQKALQFAEQLGEENFKASTGWLAKFKKRYSISEKKICGESAAVDEVKYNSWVKDSLPGILAPYSEDDIFNADETGLFYKCLPNKTLTFKNNKCHGGKLSKERVSCLLAANMSGTEKLKVLLIGKSAKPRCLKGVKWLPVDYKNNKKAWMTSDIFEMWLLELDKYFTRQNRKVLLTIDNCPAHPQVGHKLKAIKLCFFPPNMTSRLQPLDAGIIRSFKSHYKRRILNKVLDSFEINSAIPTINLFDCIKTVATVWSVDITQKTIQNCFKKSGFGKHNFYDDEDDTITLAQLRENRLNQMHVADEEESQKSDLEEQFNKCIKLLNIDDNLILDEFLNVDSDLITSEHPTDKEIVASVSNNLSLDENECREEISDDSDSEDTVIRKPSHQEMRNAFETIKLFFTTDEQTSDYIFDSLTKIENFYETKMRKVMHQNLITDYFGKK